MSSVQLDLTKQEASIEETRLIPLMQSVLLASQESPLTTGSRVEVLTTGEELLEGLISDLHAQTISKTLRSEGFVPQRFTTVGDELEDLVLVLKEITERSELCVMTGGLGPTHDDRTIDALSEVAGVNAPISETCWSEIISRFPQLLEAERSNRRQARLPEGAIHLYNQRGTAPGIYLKVKGCHIFAFPGPPQELKWCVERYLIPWLASMSPKMNHEHLHRILRVALIGESAIAEKIDALGLSPSIKIGYQAMGSEHRIKVSAPTEEELNSACALIEEISTPYFVNDVDRSLAEELVFIAKGLGVKIGFAESCTGGQLSAKITSVAGSSSVFCGSVVSYSNEVKMKTLGVLEPILIEHGAVSLECAEAMAHGARRALEVDWAVSVTGIAGPGGGTETKPVGTVCFAWSSPTQIVIRKKHFRGDRARIQSRAVSYAMLVLLKCLREESLEGV